MSTHPQPNDGSDHVHPEAPDVPPDATRHETRNFAAGQSRLGVYEALIGAPVGSFASTSGPDDEAPESTSDPADRS
jgi:hypothetical protein